MKWPSIRISRFCIPPHSSSSTGNTLGWWIRIIIVMLPAISLNPTVTMESIHPCSWSQLTKPARFPFVPNRCSRSSRSTSYDAIKHNYLLPSVIAQNYWVAVLMYNECRRTSMLAWLVSGKFDQDSCKATTSTESANHDIRVQACSCIISARKPACLHDWWTANSWANTCTLTLKRPGMCRSPIVSLIPVLTFGRYSPSP